MTTVLQYLVIAAVIGLVVFALAVFVFGRGEQLAPLSPRTSPTELPDRGMTPDDVRRVRFAMALRGYRMSDVDWALERMADEIDNLRTKIADLSGDSPPDGFPAGAPSAEPRDTDPVPDDDETGVSTSGPVGTVLTAAAPGLRGKHLRTDPDDNTTGDTS